MAECARAACLSANVARCADRAATAPPGPMAEAAASPPLSPSSRPSLRPSRLTQSSALCKFACRLRAAVCDYPRAGQPRLLGWPASSSSSSDSGSGNGSVVQVHACMQLRSDPNRSDPARARTQPEPSTISQRIICLFLYIYIEIIIECSACMRCLSAFDFRH